MFIILLQTNFLQRNGHNINNLLLYSFLSSRKQLKEKIPVLYSFCFVSIILRHFVNVSIIELKNISLNGTVRIINEVM